MRIPWDMTRRRLGKGVFYGDRSIARVLSFLLSLATVLVGVPSWARADELSQRLLEELRSRDRIIRQLTARVKVLEEKITGLQEAGGKRPGSFSEPKVPDIRNTPGQRKRLVLSDAELDRIVAGSLPRQFGSAPAPVERVSPAAVGLASASPARIQVSQATQGQATQGQTQATQGQTQATQGQTQATQGGATSTAAKDESAPEKGASVADAAGEDEERNVLRVPLASVARGGNLLRPGQFQIEPNLSYTYDENTRLIMTGFSVIPLIILGTLESEKVKNNTVASGLVLRYGLIRDLQFDFRLPVIWTERSRIRLSNDRVELVKDSTTDYGLGDLEFGFTYQPIYESGWIPDLTLSARVRAPTGRSQFDIFDDIAASGKYRTVEDFVKSLDDQGIATGFGFWGLTLGTSFVKSADPAILFGSFGYTFNFSQDVTTVGIVQEPRGDAVAIIPTAVGANFDPGDSIQFSLGVALALNSRMSVNFGFNDRIVFEASSNGVALSDSNLQIAQFNTGFTLAIRPRLSVDVTAAFGLTPDAPDFSLGMSLPMTFNSVQDLIPASWRSG